MIVYVLWLLELCSCGDYIVYMYYTLHTSVVYIDQAYLFRSLTIISFAAENVSKESFVVTYAIK